jgi:hypothetical protein
MELELVESTLIPQEDPVKWAPLLMLRSIPVVPNRQTQSEALEPPEAVAEAPIFRVFIPLLNAPRKKVLTGMVTEAVTQLVGTVVRVLE